MSNLLGAASTIVTTPAAVAPDPILELLKLLNAQQQQASTQAVQTARAEQLNLASILQTKIQEEAANALSKEFGYSGVPVSGGAFVPTQQQTVYGYGSVAPITPQITSQAAAVTPTELSDDAVTPTPVPVTPQNATVQQKGYYNEQGQQDMTAWWAANGPKFLLPSGPLSVDEEYWSGYKLG